MHDHLLPRFVRELAPHPHAVRFADLPASERAKLRPRDAALDARMIRAPSPPDTRLRRNVPTAPTLD